MKLRKQLHLCTLEGTKYLGIYLIKEVQYLYTEKCKTLLKESKEDLHKEKDASCSWSGRFNINPPQIHLYVQHNFYHNSNSLFLVVIDKLILKFI